MDAPFSTAKAQEQIRGKSTGGARPKPTSNGWESPGGRELSLIDLLITILLCVKGIELNVKHSVTKRKRNASFHTDVQA